MTALVLIPLVLPLAVAGLAAWHRGAGWTRYADVLTAAVVLATGALLVAVVGSGGPVLAAAGVLRADSLSAYLLTVVGAVAVTATWGGLSPRSAASPDGRYRALVAVFLAAMSLALLADNLGVLWVAVEATTIATAFLVGHDRGRPALEAAWKYVVLGSVGVAIAFWGIVLLYAATVAAGNPTLSWVALMDGAGGLDPSLTRLAVALAALGFATKAGLAPMHSWLPDAHSQAPAPVSGLMSGVLLAVAFYAILRIQAIADVAVGPGLLRGLLLAAGLLSLLVAALLVLAQRDLKRLLAYSSIEHMGLLALGAAVGGPLALAAVLLHILGHGLAKAAMFVVAGRILAAEGTAKVADVHALLSRRPRLAVPFLAGAAALLGFPPFSLFFSEVAILLAGWWAGLGWAMAIALVLILLVFAGMARHVLAVTMGEGDRAAAPTNPPGSPATPSKPPRTATGKATAPTTPLVLALGTVAVVGFAAVPLAVVLTDAVAALGVAP